MVVSVTETVPVQSTQQLVNCLYQTRMQLILTTGSECNDT